MTDRELCTQLAKALGWEVKSALGHHWLHDHNGEWVNSRAELTEEGAWAHAQRVILTGDGMVVVLERMGELGYEYKLHWNPFLRAKNHVAEFWTRSDGACWGRPDDDLSKAVALAALAALGGVDVMDQTVTV